ncbi:MAG TPA: 50S ribosomal protein L1 [Planctomycetota bacterium]|jgi:large subunit ribosomal protein L1|nr:50S ribosomal protein L1 [Planctomycetota bacterium]
MRRRSKRYRKEVAKVDARRKYSLEEAVRVLKSMASTKFDQSVEVALKLAIDPKKSEQTIRGSVSLPKGIGKSRRVIVFADGEEARLARDAGADEVGMDELAKKIEGGWLDFDVAIALPRTMKVISKLGKVLGPKGLMPSPKNGTVTEDVRTAVREFKAGKIEYRNDAAGNVQAAVGKLSFSEEDLRANIEAFIEHIRSVRPATVKGNFIQNASVSASMGPGLALAVQA